MKQRILVVYGTTEGHTRKIAERIGEWVHAAQVVDSANLPKGLDVASFDAFIVAGSLHETKHQRPLRHFVKEHSAVMNARPTAFLSVSLTAIKKDEKHTADAQRCIDAFLEETGLQPTMTKAVAGALLYTKYDFLKRFIMVQIVKGEGGDLDTSKDYEYTDWDDLKSVIEAFLATVESRA